MATLFPADLTHVELSRIFRMPRCYAPEYVTVALHDLVSAQELALLVDVDALERSALARIDRVMQLAFGALANANVRVFLAARYERERCGVLQRSIPGSKYIVRSAPLALPIVRSELPSDVPLVVLSDDPPVFDLLGEQDRGLALGRPELVRPNIVTLADMNVRATLWWLHEERARALAS